jgi:uncharacterized membrane protein
MSSAKLYLWEKHMATQTVARNIQQYLDGQQDQNNLARVLSTIKGETNVSTPERWITGIAGGALVAYGILRRDWLGATLATLGGYTAVRSLTGHCYLYQALGINTASQPSSPRASVAHNQGIKVERAVTVNKSPEELYRFWRNFENLPRFMDYLQSVTVSDSTHSHWVAKAPAGTSVAWDAEIINERVNELIAWRSLPGANIPNAGSVHFTPATGGRGTVVKVVLEYDPPGGKAGSLLAKLFGTNPDQEVHEELRHFKEMMEAGEIPTIEGQPSGRS